MENGDSRSTPDELMRDLLTSLREYVSPILQWRVGDPRSTLDEFVIGITWKMYQFMTALESGGFEINP